MSALDAAEDPLPQHQPEILSASGHTWPTCSCGWVGSQHRTAGSATIDWARHFADARDSALAELHVTSSPWTRVEETK